MHMRSSSFACPCLSEPSASPAPVRHIDAEGFYEVGKTFRGTRTVVGPINNVLECSKAE